MKQTTQWIAALFTVASAGLALGCGCSSEKVRLEPVRERIIEPTTISYQSACEVQQPILIKRTKFVSDCSRCYWVEPSKNNLGYAVGNFLTAPFRAITGRSLGQPDVVATYNYRERLLEPVGERFSTMKTTSCSKKHCMTKKVTLHSQTLLPVGERLTTVKVIRTTPMPVGECSDLRVIRTEPAPMPVGEQCGCNNELRVIHPTQPALMPVGEKCGCSDLKVIHIKPVLMPVGERIITKTYVAPWSSCDF